MATILRDMVTWLKNWFYTEDEVNNLLDLKQDTLVSGDNIATINSQSLLSGGDIEVGGGSGGGIYAFGVDSTVADDVLLYIDASSGVSYHLEFLEASYVAIGGVATVSVLVEENYEPVENIEVTFTSDESTTTTATTNANGVASATITFGDSTTLTATYESVTATATITVQSYLFYDACDSTYKSSEYGTIISVSSSTTTNYTAYDSGQNAYLTRANGNWGCIPILALTGEDNYKLSAYMKPKSTSSHIYRCGFGFLTGNTTYPFYNIRLQGNGDLTFCRFQNGSEYDRQDTHSLNVSDYHRLEVIKQGNNYTFNLYDYDDITILVTYTATFTVTDCVVGLYLVGGSNYGGYVKNIKAELLGS